MALIPSRNQFDSSNSDSSPSGSSLLDGPPPHAAPRPAGADTSALLGRDSSESADGAGPLSMSPKARVIAALAMILQGINTIEATVPGAISPQFMMEADSLRTMLPGAVDQMAQQASPLGLLSSIGSALAGGGMNPMMGGPAGPAAGGPPSPAPIPSMSQSAGIPGRQPMPPR